MKVQGVKTSMLIGSLALALPCLASASGVDGTLLGEIGAIGSYCSRLEQSHDGSEAFIRELTRQFGAETTSSAEFRHAYELMSDALSGLPRSQGLALCGFPSNAGPSGHGSGHEQRR